MRAELGVMATQQAGVIVKIASTMSLRIHPGNTLYVASEFGVVGLTRTAVVEYASAGIRITAICPGSVPAALFSGAVLDEETYATLKALHRMNRLGTSEEISNAVVWRASSQDSF